MLAAILAADVVGYSRLMGRDESGTLARLAAISTRIFEQSDLEEPQRLHRPVLPLPVCPSYTPSPTPDERALLPGYDQRRGDRMSVNRLPLVGRIRAVHLPEGDPRVRLTIEYSDRSKASKWYQLEVPFVDAMHLLTLLQGAKDDFGYKEPVEAPAPEKN